MNDTNWELEIAINCVRNILDHIVIETVPNSLFLQNAVVQGSLLGIKYMGKNNGKSGGVIVNIASILGLQEFVGCPVYTATKHFVVGLDRSFGKPYFYDLTGIKFLTMCPGVTDTPLISEASQFVLQRFQNLDKVLTENLATLPIQEYVLMLIRIEFY